jgi:hypothetical protein
MTALSAKTVRRIERLFMDADRREVSELLVRDRGQTLAFLFSTA